MTPERERHTKSLSAVAPHASVGATSLILWAVMIGLVLMLGANWVAAVARFQVNTLFWDQWNFLDPAFEGRGWWAWFDQQHGPHRQGIAFLLTGGVMRISGWDTRMESLWIVAVLVVATVLLLAGQRRLRGRLVWSDLWIPLAALSLRQFENVLSVPNASHSPFPLLLVGAVLATGVAASQATWLRGLLLGVLGALALFTGFGIMLWGAMFWWLILRARSVWRDGSDGEQKEWSVLTGCLVGALALFLVGYVFNPASPGVSFPHSPVWDYPKFIIVMLASRMDLVGGSLWVWLAGGFVLAVGGVVWGLASWRLWRDRQPVPGDVVAVLLLTLGIGFAVFAALGRVHLGVASGEASRYTPLMLGWWLGISAWAIARDNRTYQLAAGILGWILVIPGWWSLSGRPVADWPGTLGMSDASRMSIEHYRAQKMGWLEAWESNGHSVAAAQAEQPLALHPEPEAVGLARKLEWQQQNQVGIWRQSDAVRAWLPWWVPGGVLWLNGMGGVEHQWIGESGSWLIEGGEAQFLNVRAVLKSPGLPEDATVQLHWQGRNAEVSYHQLLNGISIPNLDEPSELEMHSLSGVAPLNPPVDLREGSLLIANPTLTTEPRHAVHWWAREGSGLWTEDESQIEEGFWGWEQSGSFAWSGAQLRLWSRSRLVSYWNVEIDGRYPAVDQGPVTVRAGGQEWTLDEKDRPWRFSVRTEGGGESVVEIINASGAAAPRDHEESSDRRELALRFTHLEFGRSSAFPVLEAGSKP